VEFRKAGQFVAVLGPAWLVIAMQTHSGQRWPLQSAGKSQSGVAVPSEARCGEVKSDKYIRLITGKLYE
jgi:hypothetical protein